MAATQRPMACDQCYTNRIKCNRQGPTCTNCSEKQLSCSWDRQSVCRHHQSYQNVDTFAVRVSPNSVSAAPITSNVACIRLELKGAFTRRSKKNIQRSSRPQAKSRLQLTTALDIKLANARCSWALVLQKWLRSSHLRVYFYSLVGYSGVSLSQATQRDQEILTELLLNKLVLHKKPDIISPLVYASRQEFQNLLTLATDAFFHFFNPYNPLFTRKSYEMLPRSRLLQFCVWRMGLSFIPDSLLKVQLLKKIDPHLLELTQPSKITTSLDTMQSLLILIFNMENSPLSKRRGFFHGSILGMTFALGLHFNDPQSKTQFTDMSINRGIERVLAYRLVIFYNFICAVKLDSYHFTIGSFHNPSLKILPTAFELYRRQFLESISREASNSSNTSTLDGVASFAISNEEPAPKSSSFQCFAAVFGFTKASTSPALKDLCVIISNECLYEESLTMKSVQNIRLQLLHNKCEGVRILPKIQSALIKLKDSFSAKASHLDDLRKMIPFGKELPPFFSENDILNRRKRFDFREFMAPDLLFEALSNPTSSYLKETEPNTQLIIDTLLFLRIHYYFCCLVLFDLASCVDPKAPHAQFSRRPLAGIVTPFITAGLLSATRLLNLLYQVSMGPFYFIRLSFLGSASQFIIRHYTTYCSLSSLNQYSIEGHIHKIGLGASAYANQLSQSGSIHHLNVKCLGALVCSREILTMSLDCPSIGSQAKQFLIMFDFFLSLHHIPLPGVDVEPPNL